MSAALLIGCAALGGGVGAAGRHAVDDWVTARWRRDFPLGILLVNISGSLLLGLLIGLAAPEGVVALLGTGVLGGYTTFSTASLGTVKPALEGRGGVALAYGVGTMLATVGAALLGLWVGGL